MEFVRTLASFIETAGALIVVIYCSAAFALVIWHRDRLRAQRLVGEGVLNALSLMLCATLLKTLFLNTWRQIGVFACVFLLRTLLRRVFLAKGAATQPGGESKKLIGSA